LNTLAQRLCEAFEASVDVIHDPPRAGDVRHSVADISLAKHELGYEPQVELAEGLRRTVNHSAAEAETAEAGRLSLTRELGREKAPEQRAANTTRKPRCADGRRYLITGGAGFIGSHLAERLRASGQAADIVVLDDLYTGRLGNLEHVVDDGSVEF